MHAGDGNGPAALSPERCPAGGGAPVPREGPDLDAEAAVVVASTLQALATPSRLRILLALRRQPHAVSALADEVGMEQSAVSHQLRLLRHQGLVFGRREGRSIVYSLYDDHLAQLLEEALHHTEHLRLAAGLGPGESNGSAATAR